MNDLETLIITLLFDFYSNRDCITTREAESKAKTAVEALLVKTRIKQTRRIRQHENDVYGTDRNASYYVAEISQLQSELVQLEAKLTGKEMNQ